MHFYGHLGVHRAILFIENLMRPAERLIVLVWGPDPTHGQEVAKSIGPRNLSPEPWEPSPSHFLPGQCRHAGKAKQVTLNLGSIQQWKHGMTGCSKLSRSSGFTFIMPSQPQKLVYWLALIGTSIWSLCRSSAGWMGPVGGRGTFPHQSGLFQGQTWKLKPKPVLHLSPLKHDLK